MARYIPRAEPGSVPSAMLAVGMHLLLLVVLVMGLRWQTRPATPVTVELWSAPPSPPPAAVVPPPPPPPPPEPRVEVKPPPPPAPEKAAPKVDIALEQEKERRAKADRERAEKADKAKAEKAEKAKAEKAEKARAEKAKAEAAAKAELAAERERIERQLKDELERDRAKLVRDQLEREQAQLRADQARRDADAKANAQAAAQLTRARAAWFERISAAVKQRVVIPDGMTGNPTAIVAVELLPSGDLRGEPRLVQSSGNKAYDEAILRAIRAASPLPKPDKDDVFMRELPPLRFRPYD